jgi:hypothetical protein
MDQGDQGAVELGPIPLGARAFEIQCVLVAHAPNVVSDRTLLVLQLAPPSQEAINGLDY